MYSNPTIIWIAREGGAFTGFKCALCAKRTRPPLLKRHLRALLPSQLCPLGFFKTAANSLKHTGTQTNKHMNKQLKDRNKPKKLYNRVRPATRPIESDFFSLKMPTNTQRLQFLDFNTCPSRNFSRRKATQHAYVTADLQQLQP